MQKIRSSFMSKVVCTPVVHTTGTPLQIYTKWGKCLHIKEGFSTPNENGNTWRQSALTVPAQHRGVCPSVPAQHRGGGGFSSQCLHNTGGGRGRFHTVPTQHVLSVAMHRKFPCLSHGGSPSSSSPFPRLLQFLAHCLS